MRITVLGAYGYTGKLICSLLNEEQISFQIAGRNSGELLSLKQEFQFCDSAFVADATSSAGVTDLLAHSDLVINCAGPFAETSVMLAVLIAKTGKKYIDITGEADFVRDSGRLNSKQAVQTNALLLHGCAFESLVAALGIQWLASRAAEKIQSVHSFYLLSQSRPSPGTRLTMKLARFRDPVKIAKGEWAVSDMQLDRLKINWPEFPASSVAVPYPLPEIVFSAWDYHPQESASYLLLDPAAAMFVHAEKAEGPDKQEILRQHRLKRAAGPDADARAKQNCNLVLVIKTVSGKSLKLLLKGNDMYGATARAVLLALNHILDNPSVYRGVINPAQLFSGREEETLNKLGFSLFPDPVFHSV